MTIKDIKGFESIRNLSDQTLGSIFKNPDQSVERVQTVVQTVLASALQARDYSNFFPFHEAVVRLNREYQSRLQQSPFTGLLQKMEEVLPALKAKADKTLKSFETKLSTLDINHPHFVQDIDHLLGMLEVLENSHHISPEAHAYLVKTLLSLRDKSLFKPSFMESRAYEIVCKLSPAFAKAFETAFSVFPRLAQEEQSNLLRVLRKNAALPLNELASLTAKTYKVCRQSIIEKRLDMVTSRILGKHPFDANFVRNFQSLARALNSFHLEFANPIFQERWTKVVTLLGNGNPEEFCTFLTHYPEMDPEQFIPELCGIAEEKYLTKLTIELLCSDQPLEPFFEKKNEKVRENLEKLFDSAYKRVLMPAHVWLSCRFPQISKPYSQSADQDCNLESGTCFQNSLDRHALLMKDPHVNGSKIPMGSTQAGRRAHAAIRCTFEDAKVGLVPLAEAQKIQAQACNRLGLTQHISANNVCQKPVQLIESLDKLVLPKNDFLGMLVLMCPQGGHAFNVQINHEQNIFRFIDDNLGVCDAPTYHEFKTLFQDYLESFYREYTQFSLATFAPTKDSPKK